MGRVDIALCLAASVLVLLGATYALTSRVRLSLAAEYRRDVLTALSSLAHGGGARRCDNAGAPALVSEADLLALPAVVQRYLRVTGSVGQPRIVDFRARWRGRIRSSAKAAWMTFEAEQVSTFGDVATRLFLMDAKMRGLPVAVYHRFVESSATFRVRLLSLFTLVDAKGPDMDRSETVTMLNDLCMLAPAALLEPTLRWQDSDARSALVAFERGAHTVRARLHFNDAGELVDFVSDDRSRASADGKNFTRERWSTPLRPYKKFGTRYLSSGGDAVTHAPEGAFVYGEFELQSIEYNTWVGLGVPPCAQKCAGVSINSVASANGH